MDRELGRLGLEYERIPAVRGDDLPSWLRPYFEPAVGEAPQVLSVGEIGCYASHLTIMKALSAETTNTPALVLEDDLRLDRQLVELLDRVGQLPPDWDLVRLSNPSKAAAVKMASLDSIGDVVRYWRVPNNTGAYLITPLGARKFLAPVQRRWRAIDEDLRRPWEHELCVYGVLPPPVEANILPSSIGSHHRALPGRKRFARAPKRHLDQVAYCLSTFGLIGSLTCWLKSKLGLR